MSENFTSKRENIDKYLNDEKLIAAYTCFYLLTNMPKLTACLDKVGINFESLSELEIFDIGSGPGTFSLAFLELNKELKISAIETSELMRSQGEKLIKGLFPNSNFGYTELSHIPKKGTGKRLGLFGHSANEMELNMILKYINNLELDHILFIEPGTQDTFKKLMEVRKKLIQNFEIAYPCPSQNDCPLENLDWCHQYIKVKQNPEVERLTQLVRKDRRNLPLTLHYYRRPPLESGGEAIIVRVFQATKFSFEWQICKKIGEKNQIVYLQIMKRGLTKVEIKKYDSLLAGDRVKYKELKTLPDGKIRGELV